jgi:hypothetical protein
MPTTPLLIKACAACGKEHEIEFVDLETAYAVQSQVAFRAGICPATGIAVYITEDPAMEQTSDKPSSPYLKGEPRPRLRPPPPPAI